MAKKIMMAGVFGLSHQWYDVRAKNPKKVSRVLGAMLDEAYIEGVDCGLFRAEMGIQKQRQKERDYHESVLGRSSKRSGGGA